MRTAQVSCPRKVMWGGGSVPHKEMGERLPGRGVSECCIAHAVKATSLWIASFLIQGLLPFTERIPRLRTLIHPGHPAGKGQSELGTLIQLFPIRSLLPMVLGM